MEQTRRRAQNRGRLHPALDRVRQAARRDKGLRFTTLWHHVYNIDRLREAYHRLKRTGAPGVDGVTWQYYGEDLEDNLRDLAERLRRGAYRAKPVKRVYIPKPAGRQRPLGVPTLEDKLVQRVVAEVMGAIYETDFKGFSYGFRPGRNQHQALDAVAVGTQRRKVSWVLDADIKSCFDSLEHGQLRGILDQRVRDGVRRRVIDKLLKAGVLEDGTIRYPRAGTPQGGVMSPLLANIYLHEVLDRWFEVTVKPRLEGHAFLIRYADDFALVCASERDASRVIDVLPKRVEKYGPKLHPEKTRLVHFRRPQASSGKREERPGSFELLGFTHYWGRSHRGRWVVKRKTASKRLTRAIKAVGQWCRANRHEPITEQHRVLIQKVRGHCGYYGITGNAGALTRFRDAVVRTWWKWLSRRAQRRRMPWERFQRLLTTYPLPQPIAAHSVVRRAARP